MVRSSWKYALVVVVICAGVAAAQQFLSPSRSSTGEQYIMVEEEGKPKQKCRILYFGTMDDGQQGCQVQAVDTGEIMTIIGMVPPSSAPKLVGSSTGPDERQIYRWGNSKSPPPGFPAPPTHSRQTQTPSVTPPPRQPMQTLPPVSPARPPVQAAPPVSYGQPAAKTEPKVSYGPSATTGSPTVSYGESPIHLNPTVSYGQSEKKTPPASYGQPAHKTPSTVSYGQPATKAAPPVSYQSVNQNAPPVTYGQSPVQPATAISQSTPPTRPAPVRTGQEPPLADSNANAKYLPGTNPSAGYGANNANVQGQRMTSAPAAGHWQHPPVVVGESRIIEVPCPDNCGPIQPGWNAPAHGVPVAPIPACTQNADCQLAQERMPLLKRIFSWPWQGQSTVVCEPVHGMPPTQIAAHEQVPHVRPLPKLTRWPTTRQTGPANGSDKNVLADIASKTPARQPVQAAPVTMPRADHNRGQYHAAQEPFNPLWAPAGKKPAPLPRHTSTAREAPPKAAQPPLPQPPRSKPDLARSEQTKKPSLPTLPKSKTDLAKGNDPLTDPSKFTILPAPPASVTETKKKTDPLLSPEQPLRRPQPPASSGADDYAKSPLPDRFAQGAANPPAAGHYPGYGELPPGSQSVMAAQSGLRTPMRYLPVPVMTVPQPTTPPVPPPPNVPQAPQPNIFASNAFTPPPGNKPPQPPYGSMPPGMPMMNPQMAYMMQQQQMYAAHYGMMAQQMSTPASPFNMPRNYQGPVPPNPFANQAFQHAAYNQPGYYGYPMAQGYPQMNAAWNTQPDGNMQQASAEYQMLHTLKTALNPSHREWAILHLADYDWQRTPHVVQGLLVAAKEDPAASVRSAAVLALVRMNVHRSVAGPTLISLKSDSESEVREVVEKALVQLGVETAAPEKTAVPKPQPQSDILPASQQATSPTAPKAPATTPAAATLPNTPVDRLPPANTIGSAPSEPVHGNFTPPSPNGSLPALPATGIVDDLPPPMPTP